jgi:hypothetical protein
MRKITVRHLVLAALPLFVACAASEDSEAPEAGNTSGTGTIAGTTSVIAGSTGVGGSGTAGTTSAGGTTAGTPGAAGTASAGTPGTAGTSPGTAGTGSGGSGPVGNCAAPTAMVPLISDFATANASNQLSTGTDVWSASPAGSMAMAMAGALHVTQPSGNWGSVSTLLNKGATCFNVDGKYTGIKFKISSPTNKSVKFIVVTPETKADSSHYGKVLTIDTAPVDTSVLFTELVKAPFGVGMTLPVDYKPSQHIIGIGFGMMEMAELMDITLDDVTFY